MKCRYCWINLNTISCEACGELHGEPYDIETCKKCHSDNKILNLSSNDDCHNPDGTEKIAIERRFETKCDNCGKIFMAYHHELYCTGCCSDSQTKKCKVCDKDFFVTSGQEMKQFCPEHEKSYYKKKDNLHLRKCKKCGKPLNTDNKNQLFCNINCKSAYNEHRYKLEARTINCRICKKLFTAADKRTLCCSKTCKSKYKVQYNKLLKEAKKRLLPEIGCLGTK